MRRGSTSWDSTFGATERQAADQTERQGHQEVPATACRGVPRTRGARTSPRYWRTLVPIVRGWVAYYRTVVSSRVFAALTTYLWKLTYKWACWSHPNKPKHWIVNRYYRKFNKFRNDRWVFGDRETGAYLPKPAWTEIERHTLVKGRASPDDPDLAEYWAQAPTEGQTPTGLLHRAPADQAGGTVHPVRGQPPDPDQPPQSPEGWERWFLWVTKKAIEADYLVHHSAPSTPRADRTHLVHATCGRTGNAPGR